MASEWEKVERQIWRSRKSGKYRVRVSVPKKDFEKTSESETSLSSARALRDKWRAEAASKPIGEDLTFDKFFRTVYFPNLKQDAKVAATSLEWIEGQWRLHISPAIGQRRMFSEMPIASEVQRFVLDGKRASGDDAEPLTHSTAKSTLRVLRAVVRAAAGDGLCTLPAWVDGNFRWRYPSRTPSAGADIVHDLWSDEEAISAAKVLFDSKSHLCALYCCITGGGLRPHEALALDYGDLEFEQVKLYGDDRDIVRPYSYICRLYVSGTAAKGSKRNNRRRKALELGVDVDEIPLADMESVEDKTKNPQSERWVTITPPFSTYLYALSIEHEPDDPICSNITDPKRRMDASRVNRIWATYWPKASEIDAEAAHKARCAEGSALRWDIKIHECMLGIIEPDEPQSSLKRELADLRAKLLEQPDASRAKRWRQRAEKIEAWLHQPSEEEASKLEEELEELHTKYEVHKRKKIHHGHSKPSPEKQYLKDFRFMLIRLGRAVHNSACRNAGVGDDVNELAHGRTPKTTGGRYYQAGSVEVADMAAFSVHEWRVKDGRFGAADDVASTDPKKPLHSPQEVAELKRLRAEYESET